MAGMTLGEKRLSLISRRVQLLAEEKGYSTKEKFQLAELCDFCAKKVATQIEHSENQMMVNQLTKSSFYMCSGFEWLCDARDRLIQMHKVYWMPHQMMTKSFYNMLLINLLNSTLPHDALYNLNLLNKQITAQQPHMLKPTQIAEEIIYSNFKPFKLTGNVFPVTAMYCEFSSHYESSTCESNPVEVSRFSENLKKTECFSGSTVMEPLVENMRKLRIEKLSKCQEPDLIHMIDQIITQNDPCKLCTWKKQQNPLAMVNCTGEQCLCTFKFEFFEEMPKFMMYEAHKAFKIMACDTLEKYEELMNEVFDLKYIERALEIKNMLDMELVILHPHMSTYVAMYDSLLYRFYTPLWTDREEVLDLSELDLVEEVVKSQEEMSDVSHETPRDHQASAMNFQDDQNSQKSDDVYSCSTCSYNATIDLISSSSEEDVKIIETDSCRCTERGYARPYSA